MMNAKYPLEYQFDSEGRRRADLSDLNPIAHDVIYLSGDNPVFNIDMAVPSVYNIYLTHSGTAKFQLINVPSDRCVTVNIYLTSGADRLFSIADDKGTILGSAMWIEGIVLAKIPATNTFILSARNYGDGLGSVALNWIKKG